MSLLPMPELFDKNEWFIIISLLVTIPPVKWLPIRFPLSITLLLLLFPVTVSRVVDKVISAPGLDFYDVVDTGKFEFFDLIAYILYAPFGYFFIYIYDYYRWSRYKLAAYILFSSLLGWGYEAVCVYFDVFEYKAYESPYSFPVYLISQSLTLLFFHYIFTAHKDLKSNEFY